jgi:hypothetical protein
MRVDQSERARLEAVTGTALILVAVMLQWDLGAAIWSDGYFRYRDLVALFTRGDPHPQGFDGAGYSLFLPILAGPLYFLGRALGQPDLTVAYTNLAIFTVALPVAFVALRGPLGAGTARRFLLLLLVGTMFTHHLTAFYAEVAAAIFCGAGLWGVAEQRRWGWPLVVLGAVSTPALLAPLALVCAVRAFEARRVQNLWPLVLGAALYLAESRLRRGTFSSEWYLQSRAAGSACMGFCNPLLPGVASILASFRKGLIFYVPALFLPLRSSSVTPAVQRWRRSMLLFTAGMVLIYAKWWDWSGDWFWGPRFFLFASLPAALTLSVRLRERAGTPSMLLTLMVTVVSLGVGLDGALFGGLGNDLWSALRAAPPLGTREWLRIAFWGIAALWLVLPLLRMLVFQEMTLDAPLKEEWKR